MFEASPSESAQVSESQINELNDKTIESDLDKRQDQMYDAQANAKTNPNAAAEATKKYEHALDLAQKEAERNDRSLDQDEKGNHKHYKNESSEIAELNNKINQLTKIIEKVVDDVYEEEASTEEQPVEESQPSEPTQQVEEAKTEPSKDEKKKEALPAFIQIMAESNISEEAFSEILDMIKGGLN